MEIKDLFLSYFPNHQYRYIDQTGSGRPPVSSLTRRDDLNIDGYEAYFTPNGFDPKAGDAKLQSCTNLNAFYVDIDGRKDPAELEAIRSKLNPTFILETQNGYHIYWLLDEIIYKSEHTEEEWNELIKKWERIEFGIVSDLKADPSVKDVPRILRIPQTWYWKKTGDKYKSGTKGVFKIKGIEKNPANRYSMDQVAEAFPIKEEIIIHTEEEKRSDLKKYAEDEKRDFFKRVNKEYPIESRDSFKALISGETGTVKEGQRNQALLITASLMKQADWSKKEAIAHITDVGWHGMEKERGGMQEITSTINSAFANNYTYSYKHEVIARNMTPEEQQEIQKAFNTVQKQKKDSIKNRYLQYEREILDRYPYLKKNEIGMFFNYENGVYKIMSDLQMKEIIFQGLEEDMLFDYRTTKHVKDKTECLLSITPNLVITDDKGWILNVKNGLLNIYTKELQPHTPNFVSLVQFPVLYDPEAQCPVWLGCLEAWTHGPEQQEKTRVLQQFSGYTLSSSMLYDKALFLIGDGGNGKSTFVDTIARVIGDDSTSHIDLEGLYAQFGMKGLIGKRLNIIEEVQGNFYESNKLKKLVSGEPVTIDIKFKDQFLFRPQTKFVFAVNIMPRVIDTTTATERRIVAVQFKNNFRNNPNTMLRSSSGLLAQELSGILNWMLEGAKDLSDSKEFYVTSEQIALLAEYRQENSSVEGFIAECIEIDPESSVTTKILYDEYKDWCIQDGRKPKSNIAFTKEMRTYGQRYSKFIYEERMSGNNGAKFVGIKIISGLTGF